MPITLVSHTTQQFKQMCQMTDKVSPVLAAKAAQSVQSIEHYVSSLPTFFDSRIVHTLEYLNRLIVLGKHLDSSSNVLFVDCHHRQVVKNPLTLTDYTVNGNRLL